jgi:hypothetical protein
MIIPDWVLEPFSNLQTAELSLQEELIELSTNEELKFKLKNGCQESNFEQYTNIVNIIE